MEEGQNLDEKYEFNCPQFVDFTMPRMNDDRADEYFDFNHEDGQQIVFEAEPDTQVPQEFEEPSKPAQSTDDTEKRLSDGPPPCPGQTEQEESSHEAKDSVCKDDVVKQVTEECEMVEPPQNSEPAVLINTGGETGPVPEEERTTDRADHSEVSVHAPAEQVQEVVEEEPRTIAIDNASETLAGEEEMVAEDVHVPVDVIETTEEKTETEVVTENEVMVVDGDETPMEDEKAQGTSAAVPESPESPEAEIPTVMLHHKIPNNIVTSFDHPASATHHAPKNMVTSWGNSAPDSKQTDVQKQRSRPVTRRTTRSLTSEGNLKRSVGDSNTQRRSLRLKTRANESPANKRRRISDRSRSQGSLKRGRQAAPAAPLPSKPFIPKLTMPTTPTFMKRSNTKPGAPFKTYEQMEMEKIAGFRKQLAERKKQSEASYKKVQGSGSYHAMKAVIPPTKPEGFTFQTDSRIKDHPMATRQDAKSFEDNLRKQNKTSPGQVHRGPTVPKPFKLTENRKRKLSNKQAASVKSSPYVSMATRVNQFHCKTPQRYHTRRSGDQFKDTSGHQEPSQRPRLTCPKTPNLESRTRMRPISVQSAAEKEEQELQEMQSYKFKAKPVNPRVMSNLNIGMKMVSHKEPTRAVGFNLESERRMKERETKKAEEHRSQEEEHFEFHALPVSSKMLEGPTGIAPAHKRPLTCPKSPAFALKNRVRVKEDDIEPEENKLHLIHANPILHVGVPFRPQLSHKTTEIQPFSFERRDKETQARKEAKIQEVYDEEERARQFKAKPILETVAIPEKKVKPATKLEPFSLAIEDKGAQRAEMWSKKMEEELNEQRVKASAFRAKPAQVVYKEPFIPQKPNKPLTEISEFNLNTDRRAAEREQFEHFRMKKDLELRENMHQQQKLKEEEERQEIERLRREEMVHKANPVRHYKAVHILPSDRPLTEACSPHFSDRFQK